MFIKSYQNKTKTDKLAKPSRIIPFYPTFTYRYKNIIMFHFNNVFTLYSFIK